MTLRQMIKRLSRVFGVEVFDRSAMPLGLSFEADFLRLVRPRPDAVAFDVGANAGQTLERFAAFFPWSRIYCFEPNPVAFAKLEAAAANIPCASAVAMALGQTNAPAPLLLFENSELCRIRCSTDTGTDREIPVLMGRLDDFCSKHNIDTITLLKTDCEGYDEEVLRGAEGLFSGGRVLSVFAEVNFRRDGRHGDFFSIHEFLTARGMTYVHCYDLNMWQDKLDTTWMNGLWVKTDSCPGGAVAQRSL